VNRIQFLLLAGGVSVLLVVAAGAQAPAQAPVVVNGTVDVRPAAALERTVDGLAAAGQTAWIGYVVDGVPGRYSVGDGYGDRRCGTVYLEGRKTAEGATADARPAAPRTIGVLLRLASGSVERIRTTPPDCDLDAGGLAVHWLTGVDPAQSVALLARYVKIPEGSATSARTPSWNAALSTLALHAAPAAATALERFVATGQPVAIRKQAAFWLGSTRGATGFATLRRLANADSDAAFRKELTFALSASAEPGAVDVLIGMARNDSNGEVRRQAIFWLGQKAGNKVAGTLADAAANDPEAAIKERAVFALSRLPNGEGVPKLIDIARTHGEPAVRKRAVFWLAKSSDPRALEYLTALLRER
jgi:HEAT repeat protein